MFCIAEESCRDATIRGIGNFVANGEDALYGATIISETSFAGFGSIFNVSINQSNSIAFEIYCNRSDTCEISCESSNACTQLTVYCHGLCNVDCDDSGGFDCPTVIEIWYPTSIPTEPSLPPTAIPTVFYDNDTSSYISSTLTTTDEYKKPTGDNISTTSVTTESPSNQAGNSNDDFVKQWEDAALWVIYGALGTACAVFIVAFIYHKIVIKRKAKGAKGGGYDHVNYFVIFQYIRNLADFWTDLLFAIVLYVRKIDIILFILSLIFVVFPFLMQCFLAVHWINRWKNWKQDNPKRLKDYLSKYQTLLVWLTLCGGFYNSIDIIRSKLFYQECFYFPLKKQEYLQLKNVRFCNIVIFENIPQLAIQLSYIFYYSGDDKDISVIVFFSMAFSLLSLLFAVLNEILLLYTQHSHYEHLGYTEVCQVNGIITIESEHLNKKHKFSHSRMRSAIGKILEHCDSGRLWINSSNVSYSTEVYYIHDGDEIYSNNANAKRVDAYFEIVFECVGGGSSVLKQFMQDVNTMQDMLNSDEVPGATTTVNNNQAAIKVKSQRCFFLLL